MSFKFISYRPPPEKRDAKVSATRGVGLLTFLMAVLAIRISSMRIASGRDPKILESARFLNARVAQMNTAEYAPIFCALFLALPQRRNDPSKLIYASVAACYAFAIGVIKSPKFGGAPTRTRLVGAVGRYVCMSLLSCKLFLE